MPLSLPLMTLGGMGQSEHERSERRPGRVLPAEPVDDIGVQRGLVEQPRRHAVEQLADPQTLYDEPYSRYVADFIGAANLVPGRVAGMPSEGMVAVDAPFGSVLARGSGFSIGDEVLLLGRPERCEVTSDRPEGANVWPVEVGRRVFYGAHVEVDVVAAGQRFRAWIKDGSLHRGATEAWLRLEPQHVQALRP